MNVLYVNIYNAAGPACSHKNLCFTVLELTHNRHSDQPPLFFQDPTCLRVLNAERTLPGL